MLGRTTYLIDSIIVVIDCNGCCVRSGNGLITFTISTVGCVVFTPVMLDAISNVRARLMLQVHADVCLFLLVDLLSPGKSCLVSSLPLFSVSSAVSLTFFAFFLACLGLLLSMSSVSSFVSFSSSVETSSVSLVSVNLLVCSNSSFISSSVESISLVSV